LGDASFSGGLFGVCAACFGEGFGGVQDFFQTRMAASSTTALERTFIALATTWSKVAGLVIVGFCGI
jgi:hypothetical protein